MSVDARLRAAAVRVPGSTSNLGAGFDCVGLALDRFLDARFDPGDEPLRVERPADEAVPAGGDLLALAFREGLGRRGVEPRGRVRVKSAIPLARGLGSSAAAVVAGRALADLAMGDPVDADAAFAAAFASEGHGDNAAPSAFGGLVSVVGVEGAPRALPLPLSPDLGFAWAAPPTRIATADARAALPASVPHDVAVGALGRLAALLHGLATGDPTLLRAGFDDALHVPYRLALIPAGEAALAAALDAGAWAATVSGSGSGLVAVGPPEASARVAGAMADAFAREHGSDGVVAFAARPERVGARALEPWAREPPRAPAD